MSSLLKESIGLQSAWKVSVTVSDLQDGKRTAISSYWFECAAAAESVTDAERAELDAIAKYAQASIAKILERRGRGFNL